MKTVILYYTYGGATGKEAGRLASQLGAEAVQVREAKKRGIFSAFLSGCPKAMHREAVPILPVETDLGQYDKIILGCPIWAGHPAPAFNAMAALLPPGKQVEVFLCSGSGDSSKSAEGTKKLIEDRGCTVVSYRDVKTGGMK
jgi:flavodoxin